jgi:peptide/nickel transport system permease protein
MIRLIIKRILASIPILLGVVTVLFFIARILPGDPSAVFLAPKIPPSAFEAARRDFGLDQPLLQQYFQWLSGILRGNLGYSFVAHRNVVDLVNEAVGNTFILGSTAVVLQLIIGILLASYAALRPNSVVDKMLSLGGLIIYILPPFWIGALLIYAFSYQLGFFPPSQMHSVGADQLPSTWYALDLVKHLFLPAIAIALPGAAGLARYLRTALEQVLHEQYILAATSVGKSRATIVLKYALPNALMPVVSLAGVELGRLLTGALVTETLFAWPGMGRLTIAAILSGDYPLILGCCLMSGFIVIMGNLLADVVHIVIDPRLRVEY